VVIQPYKNSVIVVSKINSIITLLLACSPHGKIYYISPSYGGSVNDQTAYNLVELHKKFNKAEGILCDAGFARVDDYENFITSLKKPPNGELTLDEVEFNNNIKTVRIVVENVFSQIKKWAVCREMIREGVEDNQAAEFHNQCWTIVSALHNIYGEDLRGSIPLLNCTIKSKS